MPTRVIRRVSVLCGVNEWVYVSKDSLRRLQEKLWKLGLVLDVVEVKTLDGILSAFIQEHIEGQPIVEIIPNDSQR